MGRVIIEPWGYSNPPIVVLLGLDLNSVHNKEYEYSQCFFHIYNGIWASICVLMDAQFNQSIILMLNGKSRRSDHFVTLHQAAEVQAIFKAVYQNLGAVVFHRLMGFTHEKECD